MGRSVRGRCPCGGKVVGYPKWERNDNGRVLYHPATGQPAETGEYIFKHTQAKNGCDNPRLTHVDHLPHPDPLVALLGRRSFVRSYLEVPAACGTIEATSGIGFGTVTPGLTTSGVVCFRCLRAYGGRN